MVGVGGTPTPYMHTCVNGCVFVYGLVGVARWGCMGWGVEASDIFCALVA